MGVMSIRQMLGAFNRLCFAREKEKAASMAALILNRGLEGSQTSHKEGMNDASDRVGSILLWGSRQGKEGSLIACSE